MQSLFSGIRGEFDYAYGVNGSVPALVVSIGNSATGVGTVQLNLGTISLTDGTVVAPLSTTAPITIGTGANAETVTPTAASYNSNTGTWFVTATFANLHGVGDLISSASFGLAEALNDAHAKGGGVVSIDSRWSQAGGVAGTLTGQKGWTNVSVIDARGTVSGSAFSYKAASNGANMAATTISWY